MDSEGETRRRAAQPATVWGEFLRSHLRRDDETPSHRRDTATEELEQPVSSGKLAVQAHLRPPDAVASAQDQVS